MKLKTYISKKLNSWSEWVTGIWSTLFPTSTVSTTDSMTRSRSSASVDLTFPNTVNYDLAIALYYNTKPGYKLGAFFCHSIIALPLTFMGVPHFSIDEEKITKRQLKFWQERLDYYNEKYIMLKKEIQKLCHITGTVGVFPWFSIKTGYVKWYIIKSKYISDIYTNPATQELTGITTSINYQFESENGKLYYFQEKKTYTENYVFTKRTGALPPGIRNEVTQRNPTGKLPVFFTNDKESPAEFEGHSEFEKIISLIKSYSQINLRAHEETANITPKLIQQVEDKNAWMAANGFTNISEISIQNKDFIINVTEDEKTDIIVPNNLIENNLKLMKYDWRSMVETTGIPEIWWGLKTEGNHASAQEQATVGLAFVKEKQVQATNPWHDVLESTLALDALAYIQVIPENIEISWNELSTLTEVEKAQVFKDWSEGLQKLIDSHAINLEGVHGLLLILTQETITNNFEEFREQLKEYGTLRAYLEQEYGGMIGEDSKEENIEKEDNGNGNGKGNKVFVSQS